MKKLVRMLSLLSLGITSLLFYRIRSPAGLAVFVLKVLAESITPFVAVMGGVSALLGRLSGDRVSLAAGSAGAVLAARYVRRATAPHNGLWRAFGAGWEDKIPPDRASRMLTRRWSWRLPAVPDPRWARDVAFWTIPNTDRQLLCDIWQPPAGVPPSGLAFIYFHGSAWHYLDKDFGTRPFFRHLAAQGHVVMDVAYRLCPEVDVFGMIGDVKRAIAWMKARAGSYGVNPERIVVAGGSAGGHLALLAAYAPHHPGFTSDDVKEADTSVRAVVSYYGPADLRPYREHADADRGLGRLIRLGGVVFRRSSEDSQRTYSTGEIMANLLGGQPDDVSDVYALASPITHVGPDCPPTLLFHGSHDALVPVESARALYRKLMGTGVPAVYVEFPQTEHAFDVGLLEITQNSPPAQAALYDLERFLALMV